MESQAIALEMPIQEVVSLWRDATFRALVDQYTAVAVFNPEVRRAQYEVLRDISLNGERDSDKIKAFDVASRQAGVKIPDRHEVDDRKSISIEVKHLPSSEGGFVPETRFQPPKGRREKLGAKTLRREETMEKHVLEGPFESNPFTIDVESVAEDEEE